MATYLSDQLADGVRKYPIDEHGKLRFAYFSVAALTAAYASGDQIELCKLPSGRKRILLPHCRIKTSAFGASRTLSLGHRAYLKRPPVEALSTEAEAATAFLNALDVSSAVNPTAWSATVMKYDMYSLDEPTLFATIGGGTMPIGATLEGMVAYLYE